MKKRQHTLADSLTFIYLNFHNMNHITAVLVPCSDVTLLFKLFPTYQYKTCRVPVEPADINAYFHNTGLQGCFNG
jgi:hypothetical protein